MDKTWSSLIWKLFHKGELTALRRDVLLRLAEYAPRAWPAHETLAERAGCSVRTVQRALEDGRRLGLVSWTERRIRAGWRWLRTSNHYAFHTTGQHGRAKDRTVERKRLASTLLDRLRPHLPIRSPAQQLWLIGEGPKPP